MPEPKDQYTINIKQQDTEEHPVKEETAYNKFRHLVYKKMQNKWVKTVVLAAFGAAIIIMLEVLFKIARGGH